MMEQAIQYAEQWRMTVAELKKKSPVFPMMYFEKVQGEYFPEIRASTQVMFERDNVKYHRLHIEVTSISDMSLTEMQHLNKLQNYLCIVCQQTLDTRIPNDRDEIILIKSNQANFVGK